MAKTILVCTSAYEDNVQSFIRLLSQACRSIDPNLVIDYYRLPYNNIDSFRLDREFKGFLPDGLILCHSINDRRLAVTDVTDALYDKFLPHAKNLLGRENIAVIAHDFEWPFGGRTEGQRHPGEKHSAQKWARFEMIKRDQPTAFQCSSLVVLCGGLGDTLDMDGRDWKALTTFASSVRRRSDREHHFTTTMPMLGPLKQNEGAGTAVWAKPAGTAVWANPAGPAPAEWAKPAILTLLLVVLLTILSPLIAVAVVIGIGVVVVYVGLRVLKHFGVLPGR